MAEFDRRVRDRLERDEEVLYAAEPKLDGLAVEHRLQTLTEGLGLFGGALRRYDRRTAERVDRFRGRLLELRVPVSIRWSRGREACAACGQLDGDELAA